MKIILSRKGFDSQYGKINSPILPDGTLLSLPIPQINDTVYYDELIEGNKTYLQIIKELKPNWNEFYPIDQTAHLDPDLRIDALKDRPNEWRAIFGQSASAQGHLKNKGVEKGDIFLFFGSFAETVENQLGDLSFKKNTDYPKGLHIIFGYLEIGEIFTANEENEFSKLPDFANKHSHVNKNYRDHNNAPRSNNCIYIASPQLSINTNLPGAGVLKYSDKRILSLKGKKKSQWEYPFSDFKKLNISYHSDKAFKDRYFQSAAKGQEFVIDSMGDKKLQEELENWVKKIICE